MKRVTVALAIALFATTACQKAAEENKPAPTAPAQQSTAPAADAPTMPSTGDTSDAPQKQDLEYRIVKAKIYRTEQSIDILVPVNVDVSSRRLIEYEQGEDGKYYYVSLIPQ